VEKKDERPSWATVQVDSRQCFTQPATFASKSKPHAYRALVPEVCRPTARPRSLHVRNSCKALIQDVDQQSNADVYNLGDEGIFLIIRGVGFDLGEDERVTVLDYTLGEAGDWEQTYLNRGLRYVRVWWSTYNQDVRVKALENRLLRRPGLEAPSRGS